VKKLLYIFLILVVLGIVGVVVLYMSMGRIIKAGVEKVGPRVTKCDVTVSDISVSPLSGLVVIKGLVVKNPEGFSEGDAMSLGEVRVKVVPKSLFSDRIVVKEVYIDAPQIRYEVALTGGTNVGRIQKNVEEFAAMFASDSKEEKPEEVKNAKKLQIDDLLVKNGKITVAASLKGVGTGVPVSLPEIHKTGIGAEGQKSTYEVVADVLKDVLGSVVTVGKDAATKVLSGVKDLGGAAGNAAKSLGGAAGDAAKSLGEGVKGLFNR
jgi:uncharacterized protein involved in outer membrane biogenesis